MIWLAVAAGVGVVVAWLAIDYWRASRKWRTLRELAWGEPFEPARRWQIRVGGLLIETEGRELQLTVGQLCERVSMAQLPFTFGRYIVRRDGKLLVVDQVPRSDEDFKRVDCTPIPPASLDWRGILLAAPKRIDFRHGVEHDWADEDAPRAIAHPDFPRVVIAGFCMISRTVLYTHKHLVLHVRNLTTGKSETLGLDFLRSEWNRRVIGMPVGAPEALPPRDPPPPTDDSAAEGGEFVVDLGLHIPRPDGTPQEYEIHAEQGPYRSDPVRLMVHP